MVIGFNLLLSTFKINEPNRKAILNGRSQAVRLPAAFRINAKEVFVRLDAQTGDVILSQKRSDWTSFFEAARNLDVPCDFLSKFERARTERTRPF